MRRFIAVLAAALLVTVAASQVGQAQSPEAGSQWNYTRDVKVFAGNDSFYVGHGVVLGTDSTTFELRFASSAHTLEVTNWLDISQLRVPPFLESYVDTMWYEHTNGLHSWTPGSTAVSHDSLTALGSNVTWHSQPIAMRVGAWVSSGAAATDSIFIAVQCSMDKFGYRTVWRDVIEPSYGTSAVIFSDATTTKEICAIPAGKLYGWNYMRLEVKGDGNHKSGMACRLYHNYKMHAVPDWPQHSRVRYKAR